MLWNNTTMNGEVWMENVVPGVRPDTYELEVGAREKEIKKKCGKKE